MTIRRGRDRAAPAAHRWPARHEEDRAGMPDLQETVTSSIGRAASGALDMLAGRRFPGTLWDGRTQGAGLDRVNSRGNLSPQSVSTRADGMKQEPRHAGLPAPQGLYDPRFEHDACGVDFVVHMKGHRSHDIVELGIGALCNLSTAARSAAEVNTGDGAGHPDPDPGPIPADGRSTSTCPREGRYATGIVFLPARPGTGRRTSMAPDRARSRPRRACASSAGATCRTDDSMSGDGQGRRAELPADLPRGRRPRGHGARAPGVHRAQAHRARARRR